MAERSEWRIRLGDSPPKYTIFARLHKPVLSTSLVRGIAVSVCIAHVHNFQGEYREIFKQLPPTALLYIEGQSLEACRNLSVD